ncbi:hypothetical protein [uncultured Rhodoferax sp.]|uniref:hypothetical protein n=1 Tax=uncultured Rhodoferax sp. TaxID=223188 RepID=UPI0025E1A9ED|nr:hypothetical protein [uncultured Rhodoferax sp.]
MWKSLVFGFVVASLGAGVQAQSGAAKSKTRSAHGPVAAAPVEELQPPAPLSDAQLALAQRVVLGKVPCELGAQVAVSAHPTAAGYFVLELGKQKFRMAPVPTSTGAIRLEDASGGATWLQLANKSMLLDQKQGRRLADACMNAEQVVVADNLARNPAPHLLEPLPTPARVATPAAAVAATN